MSSRNRSARPHTAPPLAQGTAHAHTHLHEPPDQDSPLDLTLAAQGFAAVGSEPRLQVLLTLVRAGQTGLTIGEIQDRLGMPASTLAHHLRFLHAAGLIRQEKRGRAVHNFPEFRIIEQLGRFLTQECCADLPGEEEPNP